MPLVSQTKPEAQRSERKRCTHSFESDRSACMRLARRDSDLGPEPVPEPVRKARARIDVHACGIDPATERARVLFRLGHDRVRVVGRVRVDVRDSGTEGRDGFDGEDQFEELGVIILRSRGSDQSRE